MNTLSPGQIYLADQRGLAENQTFRRYSTFNFEGYQEKHRQPFGNLRVLNDEMLAAAKSVEYTVTESSYVIVIPVTGEVGFNNSIIVDAGQVHITYAAGGGNITLSNLYEANWINYLYIELKASAIAEPQILLNTFDLSDRPDELIDIISPEKHLPFSMHIGRFSGRNEALYTPQGHQSKVFVFVIAGAFECQGRLLHEGDGLALPGADNIGLEALSNNAIALLIAM